MDVVADSRTYRTRAVGRARALRVPASTGAVAAATGVAGLFSLIGADSRWLAALGAAIIRAGHVPRGVPFAAAPTADWPNVPVLAELAFHGLLAAGPRGLLAAQLAAVAIALAAVAIDARALGARDGQAAVAVLVAAVAAFPELAIIRVQLFSLALLPLLMLLLRAESRRSSRRVWLAVPLLALWTNLHGAVLVGLGLLLVYLAFFHLRRRPLEAVLLGAAAGVACCLTPALWRTPRYYLGVLDNETARRGQGLWAPLSPHAPWDVVLALGAVALLALALRAKPELWELAAFAVLVGATIHTSRFGIWLVLFVAPRAARGLPGRSAARSRLTALALALGAAASLLALVQGPGPPARARASYAARSPPRTAHRSSPSLCSRSRSRLPAGASGSATRSTRSAAATRRHTSTGSRATRPATPSSRTSTQSSSPPTAPPVDASRATRPLRRLPRTPTRPSSSVGRMAGEHPTFRGRGASAPGVGIKMLST